MIYHLRELLKKMGAPDLGDKRRLEWYYFDKARNQLAGFAEIRLEAGGEFLVAELKRYQDNHVDDNGKKHERFEESFFLYAERTARPEHYRVTRLSFDGEDYGHPTKPIIELGLGVFHARALDISIRMVEQTFNKGDMLETAEFDAPANEAPKKPVVLAPAPPPPTPVPAGSIGKFKRKGGLKKRIVNTEDVQFPAKSIQQEAYGVVVPFRPRAIGASMGR